MDFFHFIRDSDELKDRDLERIFRNLRNTRPIEDALAEDCSLVHIRSGERRFDYKSEGCRTVLHCAAQYGHFPLVKLLLNYGAEVNAKDKGGKTPLHLVCKNRLIVRALLDKGADLNAQDNRGETPLHVACHAGYSMVAIELIERGADVTLRGVGKTALQIAEWEGDWKVVVELLKRADVSCKYENGRTPLHIACTYRQFELVNELLARGADVNSSTDDGWTPLHEACRYGQLELVNELLARGADVNSSTNDGWTPLHEACSKRRFDTSGRSVLSKALKDGSIARALLDKGADFNAKDDVNTTPLHAACKADYSMVVKALLEKGADVNVMQVAHEDEGDEADHEDEGDEADHEDEGDEADRGETPLLISCALGNWDITKELLERGANVNVKDEEGCTPLHNACDNGHLEVAKELLAAGADVLIKSEYREGTECGRSLYTTKRYPDRPPMTALDMCKPTMKRKLEEYLDDIRTGYSLK